MVMSLWRGESASEVIPIPPKNTESSDIVGYQVLGTLSGKKEECETVSSSKIHGAAIVDVASCKCLSVPGSRFKIED